MADSLTFTEIFIAIATGFIPSFIWLLFWLQRSRGHHEPKSIITLCFIFGGIGVFFAGISEKYAITLFHNQLQQIIVWAAIEELIKFIVTYPIALRSRYNIDALDPAIFMMASALGFAAVENMLYVLHPSVPFTLTTSLLTGGLRFFGSTLLHAVASGFVGISIGIIPKRFSQVGILFGLLGAIFLHTAFNFFILKNDTASFLHIYGYLWVAAIIQLYYFGEITTNSTSNNNH